MGFQPSTVHQPCLIFKIITGHAPIQFTKFFSHKFHKFHTKMAFCLPKPCHSPMKKLIPQACLKKHIIHQHPACQKLYTSTLKGVPNGWLTDVNSPSLRVKMGICLKVLVGGPFNYFQCIPTKKKQVTLSRNLLQGSS